MCLEAPTFVCFQITCQCDDASQQCNLPLPLEKIEDLSSQQDPAGPLRLAIYAISPTIHQHVLVFPSSTRLHPALSFVYQSRHEVNSILSEMHLE